MRKKGFVIVASVKADYVQTACYLAETIKDHYPEADITFFVPQKFYKPEFESLFDQVISEGVPDHARTKLWALSRTPYSELTLYVDADMECMHEDVSTVWDQIAPDTDILITKIRAYNGKIAKWPKGEMIHHGGFFLYRSNPKTLDFMQKWWEGYDKQRKEPWPYPESEHPISLRPWDQFTFWKLLNIDKLDINVDIFKDDARWNFVNGYRLSETSNPIIFYHHTVPAMREKDSTLALYNRKPK